MATSAKVNENISSDAMQAYLDRWMGLDRDAEKLMKQAMKACKDGPRKDQKELKDEMKDAGVRMDAFKALLGVRKAQDKMQRAVGKLDDDDLQQYKKIADDFPKDTIFGFMARKALDEAEFED